MATDNIPIKLKTAHIFRLTDVTGILHHSNYDVPDQSKGYTSIDNARALIMAVKLFEQTHSKRVESLINKYVSFLSNAQNPDGTFQNAMGYNRVFQEGDVPDECFGRCLGALCYTFSDNNTPHSIKKIARDLIDKALPNCMKRTSSRAIAYTIIGLKYLGEEKTDGYISKLAAFMADHYMHYKNDNWLWFEDNLACCNVALSWAMLTAFNVTKETRYLKIGLESLQFLESKTFTACYFRPIGNKGLNISGNDTIQLDEQPLEASEATSAYIEAFLATNNIGYIGKAKTCFLWYAGKNSKSLSLLDDETGGCHDGIEFDGLNPNQSAESVISFWLAYLEIKKYLNTDKTI